jgi:membrane protease YdiL (CAAX protease family)
MNILLIIILLSLAAGYLSYRFAGRFFRNNRNCNSNNNAGEVLASRIVSALFLGAIPLVSVYMLNLSYQELGIATGKPLSLVFGTGIGLVLITVNIFIANKPDNLRDFPYIRNREWSFFLVFASAATWIIYLLAYEAMFRGLLLFSLTEFTGKWVAITINTLLYFLVHLHRGWKEAAGSVPFGVLLCIICLDSGSFVPGFIAHVMLALPNEWLSLRAHPEMRIVKRMF